MIKAILVSMMFICGIANAQDKSKERPQVDWHPIPGSELKGAKGYIDMNSLKTVDTSKGRRFNVADLMISFDKPTIVMNDKKAVIIRSKVHTVVIECESGVAAPVADIYFTEPMPTRQSKPIASEKYPENPVHTKFQVDKGSVMYNVLCPITV